MEFIKKYISDRRAKKLAEFESTVRAENRGLALRIHSEYNDSIKRGRPLCFIAHFIGDVKIWSAEEGVL